jgi:biotin carboxyl carrier protein
VKSAWRDGAHERSVEITALGNGRFRVVVDGTELDVTAAAGVDGALRLDDGNGTTTARVTNTGERRFVRVGAMDFVLERERSGRARAGGASEAGLEAPMPGVVTRVLVQPGDAVKRGQPLLAVEAMKMEHLVRAPRDANVKAVKAGAGEMVKTGVALIELE